MIMTVIQCRFDGFSVDFRIVVDIHELCHNAGSVVKFALAVAMESA